MLQLQVSRRRRRINIATSVGSALLEQNSLHQKKKLSGFQLHVRRSSSTYLFFFVFFTKEKRHQELTKINHHPPSSLLIYLCTCLIIFFSISTPIHSFIPLPPAFGNIATAFLSYRVRAYALHIMAKPTWTASALIFQLKYIIVGGPEHVCETDYHSSGQLRPCN